MALSSKPRVHLPSPDKPSVTDDNKAEAGFQMPKLKKVERVRHKRPGAPLASSCFSFFLLLFHCLYFPVVPYNFKPTRLPQSPRPKSRGRAPMPERPT